MAGTTDVVLVPIGFISDHMEVIWDLDTQAFQTAGELGVLGWCARRRWAPTLRSWRRWRADRGRTAHRLAGTGPGQFCFGTAARTRAARRPWWRASRRTHPGEITRDRARRSPRRSRNGCGRRAARTRPRGRTGGGHHARRRDHGSPGEPRRRRGVRRRGTRRRAGREAGLAVHSFKDLPTAPADGLVLGAVPPREDPADALCARDGLDLSGLPAGARVGTGSPRRAAQVLARRPDLEVVAIRGNVETRLRRTGDDLHAVVLAAAGLRRLGLDAAITERLDPEEFLPAPAQGALAVECRADAPAELREALATLDDPPTRMAAIAERAVLARLEAGCAAPVAAHAVVADEQLRLTAAVTALDGSRQLQESGSAPLASPAGRRGHPHHRQPRVAPGPSRVPAVPEVAAALGARVAELLLDAGRGRGRPRREYVEAVGRAGRSPGAEARARGDGGGAHGYGADVVQAEFTRRVPLPVTELASVLAEAGTGWWSRHHGRWRRCGRSGSTTAGRTPTSGSPLSGRRRPPPFRKRASPRTWSPTRAAVPPSSPRVPDGPGRVLIPGAADHSRTDRGPVRQGLRCATSRSTAHCRSRSRTRSSNAGSPARSTRSSSPRARWPARPSTRPAFLAPGRRPRAVPPEPSPVISASTSPRRSRTARCGRHRAGAGRGARRPPRRAASRQSDPATRGVAKPARARRGCCYRTTRPPRTQQRVRSRPFVTPPGSFPTRRLLTDRTHKPPRTPATRTIPATPHATAGSPRPFVTPPGSLPTRRLLRDRTYTSHPARLRNRALDSSRSLRRRWVDRCRGRSSPALLGSRVGACGVGRVCGPGRAGRAG